MQCFVIARCCVFVFFCVLLYGIAWFLCFIVCYCMAYQSVVLCSFMLLCGIVFYVIACYCKFYCIYVTVFVVFYVISCYCVLLYSLCFMIYHAIVWQQCVDYRPRPNIPLKIVQILFAQNSRKYKA